MEEPEYNFELVEALESLALEDRLDIDLSIYLDYEPHKRHKERYSDRFRLLKSLGDEQPKRYMMEVLRNAINYKCFSEMN